MKYKFSAHFDKKLKKLYKKSPTIRKDFTKQFNIFTTDPTHPSLKLHKLQGKRSQQYSIWIKGNLRAVFIKDKNTYIFYDIITHDKY